MPSRRKSKPLVDRSRDTGGGPASIHVMDFTTSACDGGDDHVEVVNSTETTKNDYWNDDLNDSQQGLHLYTYDPNAERLLVVENESQSYSNMSYASQASVSSTGSMSYARRAFLGIY